LTIFTRTVPYKSLAYKQTSPSEREYSQERGVKARWIAAIAGYSMVGNPLKRRAVQVFVVDDNRR
jgi:hypothetical protein